MRVFKGCKFVSGRLLKKIEKIRFKGVSKDSGGT